MTTHIPFNVPYMTDKELSYIAKAHLNKHLSGDGSFTRACHALIEQYSSSPKALLTHSCTAALEMSALLLDIKPGDEIIMPSYTFVSTANAFVLRGGVPVFIDIRADTLNIDESLIESAITSKTKAIVPVHYAGVSCEMDTILNIAHKHNLFVIEDAAQGVMSYYKKRALGSMGDFGTYSFHETKNIISGEGGCLLVNNKHYIKHAEIIREKGTNRTEFLKGKVDKYTWQNIGSSFLPGEITAAFLFAQLEQAKTLTHKRMSVWNYYNTLLKPFLFSHNILLPNIPLDCTHGGHIYYVILPNQISRERILNSLHKKGISALSHYVPLHSSPAGQKYCKIHGDLKITDSISQNIIRLPLWIGLTKHQIEYIVKNLIHFISLQSSLPIPPLKASKRALSSISSESLST